MFDDPKQRLYELEQALKEEEWEELPAEEEDDWLADAKALLGDSPAPRCGQPKSVDFSRTVYADEEMSESDALYVEPPKRKGAGGLVFLALLELIGIGLVILWWMKWTM